MKQEGSLEENVTYNKGREAERGKDLAEWYKRFDRIEREKNRLLDKEKKITKEDTV